MSSAHSKKSYTCSRGYTVPILLQWSCRLTRSICRPIGHTKFYFDRCSWTQAIKNVSFRLFVLLFCCCMWNSSRHLYSPRIPCCITYESPSFFSLETFEDSSSIRPNRTFSRRKVWRGKHWPRAKTLSSSDVTQHWSSKCKFFTYLSRKGHL